MDKEELKRCPFCRIGQILIMSNGEQFVEHRVSNCFLGGVVNTLERWNTRVPLPVEMPTEEERPKVIVFCGSSRFIAHMAILMWEFEKKGNICMGLHYLPAEYFEDKDYVEDNGLIHHLAEQEGVAAEMDELHKRKIDLADEIFVVNVKGYIGGSTRSEIAYAEAHNKLVKYLEPLSISRQSHKGGE